MASAEHPEKRGLGKLALFGIGKLVTLTTTRAGEPSSTEVTLSYAEMMKAEGEYRPRERTVDAPVEAHGTTVSLTELKRKSVIDAQSLAEGLARLFAYTDSSFSITVVSESGEEFAVDEKLRLGLVDAEFMWVCPDDFSDADASLRHHGVTGRIVSAKKPLRNVQRGITLYAYGRMVNEPEFFDSAESSYVYSYLTGMLNVDFVDDAETDLIATDRRAVDWEADETATLREALRALLGRIGLEWRERRAAARKAERDAQVGRRTESWVASIKPQRERESVERIVSQIETLDLTRDQEVDLIAEVNVLAPSNAEFVWRHLHEDIRDATQDYYENRDYFQAVQEAIKRYVSLAEAKAQANAHKATQIVAEAFGDKGRLSVFAKYQVALALDAVSADNVENGQKHLSMGVVAGFRNVLAHEEIKKLQASGGFTFQDCLDALSIVSHLARRLSDAEVRQSGSSQSRV